MSDTLDRFNAWQKATQAPPAAPPVGTGRFAVNEFKAGLADAIGGVADAPGRLFQLAKAGVGVSGIPQGLAALTGRDASSFMPEVSMGNANLFSDLLKRVTGVQSMQPDNDIDRYLGAMARGAGGAMVGAPAASAAQVIPQMAKAGLVGTVAGAGAEGGGDASVAMGGDRALGQVLGGLGAGGVAATVGTPAMIAARLLGLGTDNLSAARPLVQKAVDSTVRSAAANTPNAVKNIDEGLALSSQIPGFRPSVAEMSNSPGLLSMQEKFSRTSPQRLNAEVAREESNRDAIRKFYESRAPDAGRVDDVRAALSRSATATEATQLQAGQAVTKQLPQVDQYQTGTRMAAIAEAEKAAAKPGVAAAYQKAFDAAPEKAIPAGPIVAKLEEILGQPLAQVKPETAPNTARLLKKYLGMDSKSPEELAYLSSRLGGTVENSTSKVALTLKEADDIRKAINMDYAAARASGNPAADTRLYNINQMHSVIDDAVRISAIPDAAKSAYAAALHKYRTEYAPRFKEGVNKQAFKDTTLNEPRLVADKFIDEYFKPDAAGGGTRSANFSQLFGKNAEARDLTKQGIMDRFRSASVNPETGLVDAGKAARFEADHTRTLDSFKSMGVNAGDEVKRMVMVAKQSEVDAAKTASRAKMMRFESTDDMVTQALGSNKVAGNVIANLTTRERNVFARNVMDRATATGSASGIEKFLADNQKTLSVALKPGHLEDLQMIAKAAAIADRAPVKGGVAGNGDFLRDKLGVGLDTAFYQIRATTAARQGTTALAFNLGAPILKKLGQTQFSEVMETALHDRNTASSLRDFLQAQSQTKATAAAGTLMDAFKAAGGKLWEVGKVVAPVVGAALGGGKALRENTQRALPATGAQLRENPQ